MTPKDVMLQTLRAWMLGDYGHDLPAEHFEQEADRIQAGLEEFGFTIVVKEPPAYMNSRAKANYRMNISVGERDIIPAVTNGDRNSGT